MTGLTNAILRPMRYSQKRRYVWSPAIAYSVGLIASDGCLQKNGRHIDLTSKDLEQLDNFSKALGREFTIGEKHSGTDKLAYRIQFSDVAYYDFLLGVGLTPVKSKTMPNLNIPDMYYASFLRGLFDGDGSCYAYYDPRWRSSFMFYIAFTSASPVFLQYISLANTRLAGTTAGSVRKSTRALSLVYAKQDSHLLYRYLYSDMTNLYLTRKKEKLESFVVHDRAGIIR